MEKWDSFDWSGAVKVSEEDKDTWVVEAIRDLQREIPGDLNPDSYWRSRPYISSSGDTVSIVNLVQYGFGHPMRAEVNECTPRVSYQILDPFKAGTRETIHFPEDVARLRKEIPHLAGMFDAEIQRLYSQWSEEFYAAGWHILARHYIDEFGEWLLRPSPAACKIPPSGWWCSRSAGHEGPCAARMVPR